MNCWISQLIGSRSLSDEGYAQLLSGDFDQELREVAEAATLREFGRGIYLRALIEVTNRCVNNCFYCGIRAANREVVRYTLTQDEIVAACGVAYDLGFRTFVLQGGENPAEMSDEWLEELLHKVTTKYAGAAITLSLGERSKESYQRLFNAGASRYFLRHETFNRAHYGVLHPQNMSWEHRMSCIESLREIGFQVGVGMMVGSPMQSVEHLVEDLKFIERFRPEMVGIGAFIPHHATPFGDCEAGDISMCERLISIVRLLNPRALIPSTTALATLCKDGRERGVLAGANVVMPNVTPKAVRAEYALYDNKAAFGSESAEGLRELEVRLQIIGREINMDRGDYKK